jgi:exoribonuclease II
MAERLNLVQLDEQASTVDKPHGILTIDCSNPHEIDDGVFVRPLDTDTEQYQVGVCVVDGSQLNRDQELVKQAMRNVEARYYNLGSNEQGYEPMIDPEMIREVDFREGTVRKALIASFRVGIDVAPTDVEVSFGQVEVISNLGYASFVRRCVHNAEEDAPIARAAAMIMEHLRYMSGGDNDDARVRSIMHGDTEQIYRKLIYGHKDTVWMRGSKINEAFMIGAGHLVGKMMRDEGRPAIYRVHDPEDETYLDFLPPDMATYSRTPGPHIGLNLTPYCRITSPLRRLEDFKMHWQLWRRSQGWSPSVGDSHAIGETVQRLNAHVVTKAALRTQPRSRRDTLGKAGMRAHRSLLGSNVLSLPTDSEASA